MSGTAFPTDCRSISDTQMTNFKNANLRMGDQVEPGTSYFDHTNLLVNEILHVKNFRWKQDSASVKKLQIPASLKSLQMLRFGRDRGIPSICALGNSNSAFQALFNHARILW